VEVAEHSSDEYVFLLRLQNSFVLFGGISFSITKSVVHIILFLIVVYMTAAHAFKNSTFSFHIDWS
jgi:hypothetical protein